MIEQMAAEHYDAQVPRKLRDFVDGNRRIDRAWETLVQWAPQSPKRVLEVGCGIGAICHRMAERWSQAQVLGLDISSSSVEVAQRLFGSPRVRFIHGTLTEKTGGNFDLVVLMDVYEHIPEADRPKLHAALRKCRSRCGRIFLSFPTPYHLSWLLDHAPEQIQPVDEHVTLGSVVRLAADTATEVMLYQEVTVWHQRDYAHAVVCERQTWTTALERVELASSLRSMLRRHLTDYRRLWVARRKQRLGLVHKRLGRDFYER